MDLQRSTAHHRRLGDRIVNQGKLGEKAGIIVIDPSGRVKRVVLPGRYSCGGAFKTRLIVRTPEDDEDDMLELSGTFYVRVEEEEAPQRIEPREEKEEPPDELHEHGHHHSSCADCGYKGPPIFHAHEHVKYKHHRRPEESLETIDPANPPSGGRQ